MAAMVVLCNSLAPSHQYTTSLDSNCRSTSSSSPGNLDSWNHWLDPSRRKSPPIVSLLPKPDKIISANRSKLRSTRRSGT